jgi:hypothetical protein
MKSLVIVSMMVLSLLFATGEKSAFAGDPEKTIEAKPSLSGKVVETIDSGRYTYVCLENNGKKIWVAVYKITLAVGQNIAFKPGIEMVNFESKTLNRTFDQIYFSAGPVDPEGTGEKVKPE